MTPNKFKEIQESMLLSTLRDNFYTRQFHKNHIRKLIIILLFAVCLCFIEFFSNNYYIICSAAILSVILAYLYGNCPICHFGLILSLSDDIIHN